MIVYVDVLIIENFVIDLFLLKITRKLIKVKASKVKQVIASLMGAIYTLASVFKCTKVLTIIPMQLLLAYIMVTIAFNLQGILAKIKASFCFVMMSMLFSGLCVYLCSFNGINTITTKELIFAIVILYLVIGRLVEYVKDRIFINNYIYDIEIINGGEKYYVRGFLDTGNELREPLTNCPCILVEEEEISSFIMDENKCYFINYSAVGYMGKIKGVKCESVKIKGKNESWRQIEAIICPCKNEKFSRDNDFNALMPRGII